MNQRRRNDLHRSPAKLNFRRYFAKPEENRKEGRVVAGGSAERERSARVRVYVWEPSVWKSALPSHPNSPFNLVHDRLEQRARAHANASAHPMSARNKRTLGIRVVAHCVRPVFISPSTLLDAPNSLSLPDYRRKKRLQRSCTRELYRELYRELDYFPREREREGWKA